MAQNTSAPAIERMHPETLMRGACSMRIRLLPGFVVAEGNAQVAGEPQVVRLPLLHPGRQGVPFLLQVAAAGGVQRDPGPGGVAEVLGVLGEHVGIDVAVPGLRGRRPPLS